MKKAGKASSGFIQLAAFLLGVYFFISITASSAGPGSTPARAASSGLCNF
jgi:hypothetical protein